MAALSGNLACIPTSRDIVRCLIGIISPCLLGSISAAVAAGNPERDSSNFVPEEARLF